MERFSIFIYLIIIFQLLHSISFNSFTIEFLIQLIPYFLITDVLLIPKKLYEFIKNNFLTLIIFNFICFLSLIWTTDIKFTLASNLELFLTSFTLIIIVFYSKQKKNGLRNIVKFSLFAIYSLLLTGIFFIDIDKRTFLGLSPSTFSAIFNYGSVCSLYSFSITKKKYHLLSFFIFLFVPLILGSLRGVLAILVGLSAYLGIFKSRQEISFYLKVFSSLILFGIIYLFLIMNIDISLPSGEFDISSPIYDFLTNFRITKHTLTNSLYLKKAIEDIIYEGDFDISMHMYAGERMSSLILGVRETLMRSPLVGFGLGNSKEIFELYGKSYSHNGLVDLFMGTGSIGIFFYLRFILKSILLSVYKLNKDLILWKRFSSLVFGTHLMLGLPFESIPLTMILALIISV